MFTARLELSRELNTTTSRDMRDTRMQIRHRWSTLVKLCKQFDREGYNYYVAYYLDGEDFYAAIYMEKR